MVNCCAKVPGEIEHGLIARYAQATFVIPQCSLAKSGFLGHLSNRLALCKPHLPQMLADGFLVQHHRRHVFTPYRHGLCLCA